MIDLPFDLENPPPEPPSGVVQSMLWRVAVRLSHDHGAAVHDRWGQRTCELCRLAWPCPGRRLAQRGLVAALRPAVAEDGATGYVDRYLSVDRPGLDA